MRNPLKRNGNKPVPPTQIERAVETAEAKRKTVRYRSLTFAVSEEALILEPGKSLTIHAPEDPTDAVILALDRSTGLWASVLLPSRSVWELKPAEPVGRRADLWTPPGRPR